ncbi:MBL fold metallo-hydrolase [Permianibacter sp. IMCC34836]|uniref:MBL fold metallo-hydrolase n=1 Tax=Permianibacter fluminis TaxID=2738515 RepID=UPI00155483FE|nr:MBL fold metallo-hydrolase [Permianibacter fluminis]NQD35936.1 MBL fold metallo-hydrolase [Permianibacter fluminis]
MEVKSFFHPDTGTWTHVVSAGSDAVVIDPVLDFDARSATVSTRSADQLLAWLSERTLQVHWLLETHAHADHISAGAYLKAQLGAPLAIGAGIVEVLDNFADTLGITQNQTANVHGFDRLLRDGDVLQAGSFAVAVMATPGHTADSLCYRIGQHAFVGDTLFAPDVGSARCDFPGGSAEQLFSSIQALLNLPDDTTLHLCHDYPVQGRAARSQTSVAEQRADNIHVGNGKTQNAFVELRQGRDANLPVPALFWPSIICNLRGGELPAAAENGVRYLSIPLNQFGKQN